jgi:hypothetical protein
VAIVEGSFYTPDLFDNLTAQGVNVVEITSYTAASLAAFDAVIHYGNSFTDTAALETYANAGGTVVLTPWAGLNFSIPASMQVFGNGGSTAYSQSYPGVTVLSPGDPLLDGVSFPPGSGGFNIGRITGIDFVAGATQIADWADGVGMVGRRTIGAGEVIGINMHVITSDTAFDVIDQPWATQLFVNAVSGTEVPEPISLALLVPGALGALVLRMRRRSG